MLITLKSNDGQFFAVSEKAVEKCGTIKKMRDSKAMRGTFEGRLLTKVLVLVPSSDPIPLANVNSAVLRKVSSNHR